MTYMLPSVDELEVSLFGPGYGESVLLHIGEGNWIIIDSCIDQNSGEPAALQYLKNIGVDPSKNVKLVIATHWHDDHVRGLGKILQECKEAIFVCPVAIKTKEFTKLIERSKSRNILNSDNGVCEFTSIINTLRQRKTPPKYAIADRKIWHYTPKDGSALAECTIHSLSPSDAEVEKALNSLSKLIPKLGADPIRIPPPPQNDCAVVLWVNMGPENILLLGSDLEESGNNQTGWSAVLNLQIENNGKASIFKVAHHGSTNGHHQPVWDEMLNQSPCVLITPFTRGKKTLPSQNDIDRIIGQTEHAYITAPSKKNKKVKQRDVFVKKIISQYTLSIKNSEPECGQIKMRRVLRSPVAMDWDIELFGGASQLINET